MVAANSATDDPDCVYNITVLGSRYLVLVVGTEDAAVRGRWCADVYASVYMTHNIIVYSVCYVSTMC